MDKILNFMSSFLKLRVFLRCFLVFLSWWKCQNMHRRRGLKGIFDFSHFTSIYLCQSLREDLGMQQGRRLVLILPCGALRGQ